MNRINVILLIALVPVIAFIIWFLGMNDGNSGFFPFNPSDNGSFRIVRIGNVPVQVEIADTPVERTLGLSGRSALGDTEGLLFVFDGLGAYGIWMKDMQFPIDIIWIAPVSDTSSSGGGETLRVVDIKHNATPESFPEIFYPKQTALYVLEVNSGFTEVRGISIGDRVELPN